MRVLTVRQPWASLIALGVKTIETRSWSTDYRGPLAIHAAATWAPGWRGRWFSRHDLDQSPAGAVLHALSLVDELAEDCNTGEQFQLDRRAADRLPTSAVIATVDLDDCLPVVRYGDPVRIDKPPRDLLLSIGPPSHGKSRTIVYRRGVPQETPDVRGQVRYAPAEMWRTGNHGWLLDNARALAEPIPWKGGLGLRHAPPELAERIAEQVGVAA